MNVYITSVGFGSLLKWWLDMVGLPFFGMIHQWISRRSLFYKAILMGGCGRCPTCQVHNVIGLWLSLAIKHCTGTFPSFSESCSALAKFFPSLLTSRLTRDSRPVWLPESMLRIESMFFVATTTMINCNISEFSVHWVYCVFLSLSRSADIQP